MCKFSFQASVQKSMQNFFVKFVQSASSCLRLSKKLQNVEIQWPEEGLNIDLVG